jgi:hypothetical protein
MVIVVLVVGAFFAGIVLVIILLIGASAASATASAIDTHTHQKRRQQTYVGPGQAGQKRDGEIQRILAGVAVLQRYIPASVGWFSNQPSAVAVRFQGVSLLAKGRITVFLRNDNDSAGLYQDFDDWAESHELTLTFGDIAWEPKECEVVLEIANSSASRRWVCSL